MGVAAIGLKAPRGTALAQVVQRAGENYERWSEQVAHTGFCANPVRLMGHIDQVDKESGEVRRSYSTEVEPDATLLVACGNRRPSCAARYRQDAFQLVAAGLRGVKGFRRAWPITPCCS